jgi:hypothetical protein
VLDVSSGEPVDEIRFDTGVHCLAGAGSIRAAPAV